MVNREILFIAGNVINDLATCIELLPFKGSNQQVISKFVVMQSLFDINQELLTPEEYVVIDFYISNVTHKHAVPPTMMHRRMIHECGDVWSIRVRTYASDH